MNLFKNLELADKLINIEKNIEELSLQNVRNWKEINLTANKVWKVKNKTEKLLKAMRRIELGEIGTEE
jgi:hypothetical protein